MAQVNYPSAEEQLKTEVARKYAIAFDPIPTNPIEVGGHPAQLQNLIPTYTGNLLNLKKALETPGLPSNEKQLLADQYTKTLSFMQKVETAYAENNPSALGFSNAVNLSTYLGPTVTQSLDTLRSQVGLKSYQPNVAPEVPTYKPPVSRDEELRRLLPTLEPSLGGGQSASPLPQVNPGIAPQPAIQVQPIPPQPVSQPQSLIPQPGQQLVGNIGVPIAGNISIPTVRRDISTSVEPGSDQSRIEVEAVRQQDQAQAIAQAQAQAQLQAIQQYQQGLIGLRPTVEQEAQRQFQQSAQASGVQQQILNQALNQQRQQLSGIRPLIETEAERQYGQLNTLAGQQDVSRQQRLSDLGSLLNQRQSDLFSRATPQLAEQAQTAGLLQSSGFGEALAREYKGLTADTQYQLGQQGLSDRDAFLLAQQQALGQRQALQGFGLDQQVGNEQQLAQQGFQIGALPAQQLESALSRQQQMQSQGLDLATGLQTDVAGKLFGAEQQRAQDMASILAQRQQLQLSGLQRDFSTKDMAESARLAQQYGLQVAPQGSGGGGSPFGSLLGGAATGAAIGSVVPGIGTLAGAGIGAATGLLGGKKGK